MNAIDRVPFLEFRRGTFFIFYFGLDFWVFLGVSYETIQVVF
jgi:hypothetical protein